MEVTAPNPAVLDLLHELEKHSDKSDEQTIRARKDIWEKIVAVLQVNEGELEKTIAGALRCQPITVRRWMTGAYSPRSIAMGSLKSLLARTTRYRLTDLALRPEPMIRFYGSDIGICTLQHFFYCMQFAKFGLCAKGWLGYRAGRHPGARNTMVALLRSLTNFEMHYVYSPNSEAERSLLRFYQYLGGLDEPNVKKKVFMWRTPEEKDANDGLRYNIPSPFVLIYEEEGVKTIGRPLSIWYEMVVNAERVVDFAASTSYQDQVEHIFVEIPLSDSLDLWNVWRRMFVNRVMRDKSNEPFSQTFKNSVKREDLKQRLSLFREYDGPGSPLEALKQEIDLLVT